MKSAKNMFSELKSPMPIAGLVKSSVVDYPGHVSCILFTGGCNYNCFYCHNRSLLDGTPDVLPPAEVESFLIKRAGLLDGVVITGGEPTLQSGLVPYLEAIKELGYKIKLDTNGSAPQVIEQILLARLCDYFAVDYKAPANRYPEICGDGISAEPVLETIALLKSCQVDFEVRTTVIPQLKPGDLMEMAKELPVVPRYVLNPYRPPKIYLPQDEARINKTSYTQTQIVSFALALREVQPHVTA